MTSDLGQDFGLAGKVAIVTGGGAAGDGIGNGRAAAILLARAGARVLVVDRQLDLGQRTVEMIADRLTDAWARTDRIFEILAPGGWLAQPIALRHPFIFYLGHLPAFAWNQVCRGVLGRTSFDPVFDELFERGIGRASCRERVFRTV